MMQATRIERQIVLLGAGNANLQAICWWAMAPIANTSLTLITESLTMPYSGMLPGCIAGQYSADEITVDIARLCAAAGVVLVNARADRVDAEAKQVLLDDRPPVFYDLLSINIGSQPATPNVGSHSGMLFLKPLHSLLRRLAAFTAELNQLAGRGRVVVVGGGASSFEICLALQRRWRDQAVDFEIVTAGDRVLSRGPRRLSAVCARVLAERRVQVRTGAKVTAVDTGQLCLADGQCVPFDLCVWATPAAPPPLLEKSGLALDAHGFIQVADTLQSVTAADVFAVGDCAGLLSHPELPKAGVFSVRSGPVLWDNLQAALTNDPLRPYHPQRRYLFLLNCADGSAVMSYGKHAAHGTWAFRWKDYIDRGWMRKLQGRYAAPMVTTETMPCGGCGSKIGASSLRAALSRLDLPHHDDVVVGCRPGDDAAVIRLPQGKLEVQTVDFFRACVSDPYLLGRLAALNALSDVQAMNATPFSAMALVTLPYSAAAVSEEQLFQVLSGGLAELRRHDAVLTGGHSIEGPELQIGFAVTGYAMADKLFRKSTLSPGDGLVLTKAVGSGALLRAAMLGQCRAEWYEALLAGMLQSNLAAVRVLHEGGVSACTDVTGFGLAGHLLEMLCASKLGARLQLASVPVYAGFDDVASRGLLSTLQPANAAAAAHITGTTAPPPWLFDPQTCGGLLAGVAAGRAEGTVAALRDRGYPAALIGQVTDGAGIVARD